MSSLLSAYARLPIKIVYGDGFYLFDDEGRDYLDFASGIAVTSLGHNQDYINKALEKQIHRLWHCSNIFTIPEQERLADRLTEQTFADKVFFCSSGLEALECAIKVIRKNHYNKYGNENGRIITFENGFHGRSLATSSGFGVLLEGFDRIEAENIELLEKTITKDTAGIIIETVQSGGGVYPLTKVFLEKLREIADQKKLLVCFDEVQTGFGRTGALFDYKQLGIEPDIMTCAKAMGNGFPLAACLMKNSAASCITPGSHGSTYGGNPLAMAVGNAVLDCLLEPGFFDNTLKISEYFVTRLVELKKYFSPKILDIRGKGLLLGIEVNYSAEDIMKRCINKGLVVTRAGNDNVIRLLPPLQIDRAEVDIAINILKEVFSEI